MQLAPKKLSSLLSGIPYKPLIHKEYNCVQEIPLNRGKFISKFTGLFYTPLASGKYICYLGNTVVDYKIYFPGAKDLVLIANAQESDF